MHRFKVTVSRKIYALIGLGFLGLLGITLLDSRELDSGLLQQKQLELRHLGETALSIVKEEHAAFQSGSITEAEAQKRAAARVVALRYGDKDYFWINDTTPRMVSHPTKPEMNGTDLSNFKDANGKTFYVEMANLVRKEGSGYVDYYFSRPGFDQPQPKLSYVVGFAPWNWVIGTGVYISDLRAQTWASTQRALVACALLLLVTLALSILVARSITGPLREITAVMTDLAGGRLDIDIPGVGRADEVGEMAGAVEIFKRSEIDRQRLEAEQREAENRTAIQRKSEMHKLANDFEGAVGGIIETLSHASSRLEHSAGSLSATASQTRRLPPWSRRPPAKQPPMSNRWPRQPRSCRPR